MKQNAIETMTIVDAALYDTEFVDPGVNKLVFFSNARMFSSGGATKTHKKDTNLVGMGGMLPRGHAFLAKGVLVELEGATEADEALVRAGELTLDLGGLPRTEVVSGKAALTERGAMFKSVRPIVELQTLSVTWAPSRSPSGSFRMKVSLVGVMKVPVPDDEASHARAKETYARKRAKPVAPPKLFVRVHQACVKDGDKTEGVPMTRRAVEAQVLRELDKRGVSDADARNRRKAWWCSRCGSKVSQGDVVVAVEVRA